MSKIIKIERPKVSAELKFANFHDVFYEEGPELVNCSVNNSQVDNELIDRLILSKVIFKNVTGQLLKLSIYPKKIDIKLVISILLMN